MNDACTPYSLLSLLTSLSLTLATSRSWNIIANRPVAKSSAKIVKIRNMYCAVRVMQPEGHRKGRRLIERLVRCGCLGLAQAFGGQVAGRPLTSPKIQRLFFIRAEQPQKPTRTAAQPSVMNDQASSWNSDIRLVCSNTSSCDRLYLWSSTRARMPQAPSAMPAHWSRGQVGN